MGMFDSIYINIKCPRCGEEREMECQTKDLDCTLEVWRKGDHVTHEPYEELYTITNCTSTKCRTEAEYRINGYFFHPVIKLKDGIVTGEYYIR